MRFNLSVAEVPYTRAAEAVGVATPAALIERIEALTAELGLPQRLRDVGVAEADLDKVVDHVLADAGSRANIKPVDAEAVREVLRAAW
jgi:alcohol dehydrogenase class IV